MNLSVFRARAFTTAAAILIPFSLIACDEDAVTDLTADRPVLNLLVAPGAAALPGGSSALSGIQISNFDLTVPDAFGRATGGVGAFRYNSGGDYYGLPASDINGNAKDKRAPALSAEVITLGGNSSGGVFILGPGQFGGPIWDVWADFNGAPPNTTIYVGLARYGVNTQGQLDQAGVLLGQGARVPDQLVLAGGTPGGNATRAADLFNAGAPYPAEANANPFVLGSIQSDADGVAYVDVVFSSFDAQGNAVYYPDAFDPAQSPVGINRPGTFASDQYNYLVLWSENPLTNPNAQQIARVQLAADLDGTTLNVRNNAFAPFPTAITNTATFKDLPGGANAFAVPGRITLNLSALPELGSNRYQAFLFSEATNSFLPLTVTTVVDDVETEGVTTFQGGENLQVIVDASDAVDFAMYNSVVISIEPAAGSASPTAPFLFTEYLSSEQALSSGALTLGTFAADDPSPFRIAGSGGASFFADSLIVQLVGLVEPPAGFHYQSYLVNQVGPNIEATLRLHTLDTDELGRVRDVIAESEVTGGFAAFNTYIVALEPDGTPGLGVAHIQVSENYLDKFGDFFDPES